MARRLGAFLLKHVEHLPRLGIAFDGDGDRCGVVDNTGEEIFADKVGVMLARDMSAIHKNAQFVVDVKSTGLFMTDPVLKANGVMVDYFKTGHSYIKRRTTELDALAGFEKSRGTCKRDMGTAREIRSKWATSAARRCRSVGSSRWAFVASATRASRARIGSIASVVAVGSSA